MENRNARTRVVFIFIRLSTFSEVHFTEKGSSKVVQWLALALHNENTVVSWGLSVWSYMSKFMHDRLICDSILAVFFFFTERPVTHWRCVLSLPFLSLCDSWDWLQPPVILSEISNETLHIKYDNISKDINLYVGIQCLNRKSAARVPRPH